MIPLLLVLALILLGVAAHYFGADSRRLHGESKEELLAKMGVTWEERKPRALHLTEKMIHPSVEARISRSRLVATDQQLVAP